MIKVNETKNKKQIKNGFANHLGFSAENEEDYSTKELKNWKLLLEKNKYLNDQYYFVEENKFIGGLTLNLTPIYNYITPQIRRINRLYGINEEIQTQAFYYIIKKLYQDGVKSIVMMTDIDSSDRKIFERLRNKTTLEQTLFTVFRREGPDFDLINSWVDQSERVDYIEIALQRLKERSMNK